MEQYTKKGVLEHIKLCKIKDLRIVPEKRTIKNIAPHFPFVIKDLVMFLQVNTSGTNRDRLTLYFQTRQNFMSDMNFFVRTGITSRRHAPFPHSQPS
jgi:hypothetical protein